MENNLTAKEAYVYAILSTINVKSDKVDLSKNSLVAVTAAGTISGTYISKTVKEELESDTHFLLFNNVITSTKEYTSETLKTILLKDVTLISKNGIKECFHYLFLFIEDIIAISFANVSED